MIAVQHLPSIWSRVRKDSHAPMLPVFSRRLHQWLCGLRGHELVRIHEPGCLALCCLDCGLRTPGWRIEVRTADKPLKAPPRARLAR